MLTVLTVEHIRSSPALITAGPAIVANAPQLNLRSCAATTCSPITILNKGDLVMVTQSFSNGWKAVTVKYSDGTSVKGYVNGDFLRRR